MKQVVIAVFAMLLGVGFFVASIQASDHAPVVMTNERLESLIKRIDKNPEGKAGQWLFEYEGIKVRVYTDEKADRMRIMAGVASIEDVSEEVMRRMLQANFDSALDARYAVAQDAVWSVFLHPLSSLSDQEFFSGLGQTITLVASFGTTYTSGLLMFQGGDSQQEQQRYYLDIMEKGLAI